MPYKPKFHRLGRSLSWRLAAASVLLSLFGLALAACSSDYAPVCTLDEASGFCSCLARPDDETSEISCEATGLTFCCQEVEYLTEENSSCGCQSPWKCTGTGGLCACTLGRVAIPPEVDVESCNPVAFPGRCCFDPGAIREADYENVCVCGRDECAEGLVEVPDCEFATVVEDLAQPYCDTLGGGEVRVESCSG